MRHHIIIILILIIGLPAISIGQNQRIKDFYRKYKHTEDTFSFSAPGWMIRLGAGIAQYNVEKEDEKAALELARKIRKAKILVMENHNPVDENDIRELMEDIRKESFEDLILVREDGNRLNILIKEEGEWIKEMLILADERNAFSFFALKTQIHIDDLADFMQVLLAEEGMVGQKSSIERI